MMTHTEIERQDIIERYVRDQLPVEERRSFQEHFLTCDDCFADVQMHERFLAGVQHSSDAGLLIEDGSKHVSFSSRLPWLRPAFVIAVFATVILAATVAWLVLVRLPRLREEVARERETREQLEQQKQREIDDLNARLAEQQAPGKPEQISGRSENAGREDTNRNSSNKRSTERGTGEMLAQNVPIVALQATRGSQDTNELGLPVSASRFVCWIEIAPQSKFATFRVEVFNASGLLVSRLDALKMNARNAVVASLPAQKFASGDYLVKLYGMAQSQTTLVGEYKLRIAKKI